MFKDERDVVLEDLDNRPSIFFEKFYEEFLDLSPFQNVRRYCSCKEYEGVFKLFCILEEREEFMECNKTFRFMEMVGKKDDIKESVLNLIHEKGFNIGLNMSF
jgi:hypothetical protein